MSAFPDKDSKQLLMTLLKVMGGHKAVVGFQGGGDSGSIDDVTLLNRKDEQIDIEGATLPWTIKKSVWDKDESRWVTTYEKEDYPLEKILIEVTENALEETGLDWFNNDGGQGTLSIDLSQDPPQITLDVGINYTRTDDHQFDLTDEEEEEGEPTEYADLDAEDKARKELLSQIEKKSEEE